MCNPRRVHVAASRALAESWQHEVRRVISRSGEVTARATTREPLDAAIGLPTLTVLADVLSRSTEWRQEGDSYTHELDGGWITYHADTQELEITAVEQDRVEVEASSTHRMDGDLAETMQVRGTGTYYDDNYGGITEDDAQRAAVADTERQFTLRRQELLDEARAEAERLFGEAVGAAAGAQADEDLARRGAERETELRRQAAIRLTAVGIQGRNLFHQALATAYRDAILAFARSRGAEGISWSERDGVVEIQFEMQA